MSYYGKKNGVTLLELMKEGPIPWMLEPHPDNLELAHETTSKNPTGNLRSRTNWKIPHIIHPPLSEDAVQITCFHHLPQLVAAYLQRKFILLNITLSNVPPLSDCLETDADISSKGKIKINIIIEFVRIACQSEYHCGKCKNVMIL